MLRIGSSSHGESRLRVLRIVRRGDRDDPRELAVSFRFEGDFAAAFHEGRAHGLPPADGLKNLVHGTVREHGADEIEQLGMALCDRVLQNHPPVTRVCVEIVEETWSRLHADGKAQGQAFMAGSPEQKTATVTSNGKQIAVVSGVGRLSLMRSAGFAPASGATVDDGGGTDCSGCSWARCRPGPTGTNVSTPRAA